MSESFHPIGNCCGMNSERADDKGNTAMNYRWNDDNLRMVEHRLILVEIIVFPLAAFAFGFGFITALAFWG
jgi:hypothetical protein